MAARSTCVGPLIYGVYEAIDASSRPEFKKFMARAPSGSEIVAAYKPFTTDTVRMVVSGLQDTVRKRGLRKHSLIIAEVFPDGFMIVIKGDFSEAVFTELRDRCEQLGIQFGLEVQVTSGRFAADQLRELS